MRLKLQFIATLLSVLAILAGVLCKKLVPQYWTDWYVAAIALFWLIEMVLSFVLAPFETHINQPTPEGRRFMRVYMIAKGVKLLITIGFIVAGVTLMTQHGPDDSATAGPFAGATVGLYLLHLAGETYVVTKKKA